MDNIRLELLSNYGNNKILATDESGDLAFLNSLTISPFKVWAGYVSQTGTSAPTVGSVVANSIGGTLVWSYVSAGVYRATLTGAFPAGKLFAPFQMASATDAAHLRLKVERIDNNIIEVTTYSVATPTNALLSTTPLWFIVAN